MTIERTKKEIIIRLSPNVDTEDLQSFLNYARYKELTANYSIPQKEVDVLAKQINKDWWTQNKNQFSK